MGYIAYRVLRKRGSGRKQEVSLLYALIIVTIIVVGVILMHFNLVPGLDTSCYNTRFQSNQVCGQ